ncbi:hypothetical protein KAR91_06845 [Candidatus Pacearchaeota archaeon]|nr:hypothetical protein [Candidatus Pacearchaeota archaeon]
MVNCPICDEELHEESPGVDNWSDDNDEVETSYIVREMKCDNNECPLEGKRLDIFFDYSRIDVEGDEIDIEELKREYQQ